MTIEPRLLGIATMLLKLPRMEGMPQRLPRLTRAQTDPLHTILGRHLQHQTARSYRLLRHILKRPRAAAKSAAQPSVVSAAHPAMEAN